MVLMPLSLSASMMRWKPSVISRSVSPAGFSCTAASDIVLSRKFWVARFHYALSANPRAFNQVVGVFRNVLGQTKRVRAYQLLGTSGFARLQCFDDVHVIVDRAVGAILLADRFHADHPHMGEQ